VPMTPLRTLACAVLLLALVASGCTAQAGSHLVVSSDPVLRSMAAELLPDLAARAGMELREPVRLEARSRAELVRYLEAKLDEELPAHEARARVDAYALLGMVPEDLDLRAVLLGLYTEQVAGFYEPDSTALFVLDDQPEEAMRALLVHELVHAVQDQSADLDALTDPGRGSDRATAAQAAIEGHATLVMFEYLTEQMTGAPVDLGQIPDFASQLRPALEAMNQQFPALASAPKVVRESLLFPYIDGAGYVQRLWGSGERSDPFGPELPLSTEQILEPGAEAPTPIELTVEGAADVLDDVLGALEIRILLEEVAGLGAGEAWALASAWDGDRFVLVEPPEGGRALGSFVVWERRSARDRFVEAVRASEGRFGGPVSVEATELDGRPASLLRVGGGAWSMTARVGPGGA
jgi:hypothetical protein